MCEDGTREGWRGAVDVGVGRGGEWEGYARVEGAGPEGLNTEPEFGTEVVVVVNDWWATQRVLVKT